MSKKLEQVSMKDALEIIVLDKNGKIKQVYESGWKTNTITNAGRAAVAGLITADVGGTAFDYIAIGTGTTAPTAADTALQTETHRIGGTAVTGTRVTTNVTNDTMQLVGTFSGYTGTEAITESGVFNAATAGTMLCRQTFNAINVNWGAGDSIQITWKVQIG